MGQDRYTSPTQTDTYLAVGDTSPSTGCQSCEHKELVMDSWGRTTSEKMVNDPIGTVSVDTSYDPNGQVQTVSHPYQDPRDKSTRPIPMTVSIELPR